MRDKCRLGKRTSVIITLVLVVTFVCPGWAVSSKVTRQTDSSDLLKGQIENVVIGSRGTIQLGRAAEVLVAEFEDVWSINSIVVSGGTVYIGTSPNGAIYKYSLGELTKIYQMESSPALEGNKEGTISQKTVNGQQINQLSDVNELVPDSTEDVNTVETAQYLSNEHIFAMATDVAGRLLAGISGNKCKLFRFEADEVEIIFEPNDAKYIFAIATDGAGNIYLGTGPEGKVYRLDSFGKKAQLIYDSHDKNILSLAIAQDGFIYAGSDSRGLVYKINPRTKTATVLYDSDQPEITALLFAGTSSSEAGDLYAAATSADVVQAEATFATQLPMAGRPESPPQKPESVDEDGQKLQIANTKERSNDKPDAGPAPPRKRAKPGKASYIYKITKDGYVTDVFSENAVFFCLAQQDKTLLVGTGNNAQLFSVEPVSEQDTIIYEDQQASQVTAVAVSADVVYLGTANPAKLIQLGDSLASEGTYTSDLIDAGQPARWGKLQIEGDIPQGCRVLAASRSGNVKDINDPTFSQWTEPTEVTKPVQLSCPLGRFCQYKLVLQSEDGHKSPLIREIAVASTVPNLAPKVESVDVSRIQAPDKTGMFKISYKAEDDNGDDLIYRIDFRKLGRTSWIELEDELETDSFEWNGKTVEDGRYEIRITVDDQRSNSSATKLTGSRISDPVIVDTTGPVIQAYSIEQGDKAVTLRLRITDQLSAIGKLDYTIDSNAKWKGAVPDDLVNDTTDESFTILIEELEAGEHIIAVRISDDVDNVTYKTFELNSQGQ